MQASPPTALPTSHMHLVTEKPNCRDDWRTRRISAMAFIAKWQASPNNPGRDMARAPCVVVTSDPGEQSVQVL